MQKRRPQPDKSPNQSHSKRRVKIDAWKPEQLLPALLSDEYAALKESISRHGLRVPIIVDQHGKIIDGWHRQQACDELGIFCSKEIRHFESNAERLMVAVSLNTNRRHLTRVQRREIIANLLKADPGMNDNHLGEVVGVSKNTVAAVRAKLESTRQIDKLEQRRGRDGKDRPAKYRRIIASTPTETEKAMTAINDLPPTYKILDSTTAARSARRYARKLEIAAKVITPLADDAIQLHHCRFQELDIAPGSAKLVCTDIPYGKEFLPELSALGDFAKRVLIPGGLMVTYSGQYYLTQVMQAFAEHLTYRWMLASTWDGDAAMIHPLDLTSKWKPILVFSKGNWQKRGRWCDLLHCDAKEKDWHPWQQPLQDVEMLVRYFSEPGDLVVDPCGGGFTAAVACRNLGRRCIACDVDEQCVSRGWERLAVENTQPTRS
jgi:site-specific DNA-methyltransferase (adenine-specific)